MAIDTENKRRSVQVLPGFPFILPVPNDAISEGDRAILVGVYAGDFQQTYNTPILTLIINKITDLIDTYMTQANGFSQDYGSVNEYKPSSRTYPAIFYEYPESDSLDNDFEMENRYSEETPLTLRVISDTGSDLEVIADRVISDFKKLFAEFQKTLKVQGLIDYRYLESEKMKRTVKAYPLETRVTFLLKYRRIRDDIYTVDPQSTAETFSGSAWSSPTPIWNTIISQIKTLIGNMTIANNYNFDYGSIDEYDPDSRTYPAVFLEYNDESGISEENTEIFKYTCVNSLVIKIISDASSDLDKTMLLVRSDFNKMFADNRQALEAVGMEEAEYQGSSKEWRTVKDYPTMINLNHLIHYNTQKKNPYLT